MNLVKGIDAEMFRRWANAKQIGYNNGQKLGPKVMIFLLLLLEFTDF